MRSSAATILRCGAGTCSRACRCRHAGAAAERTGESSVNAGATNSERPRPVRGTDSAGARSRRHAAPRIELPQFGEELGDFDVRGTSNGRRTFPPRRRQAPLDVLDDARHDQDGRA